MAYGFLNDPSYKQRKEEHLAEQWIAIGERCVVTARQPFDGPVTVRFGEAEHMLGRTLARATRIELHAS